jgi:hypothetical protein
MWPQPLRVPPPPHFHVSGQPGHPIVPWFVLLLQTFDFNALETLLLMTSLFILLAGMTFQSGVTTEGSGAHTALTVCVALVLVGCVVLFVAMLAREVLNSVRFARRRVVMERAASRRGLQPGASLASASGCGSPGPARAPPSDGSLSHWQPPPLPGMPSAGSDDTPHTLVEGWTVNPLKGGTASGSRVETGGDHRDGTPAATASVERATRQLEGSGSPPATHLHPAPPAMKVPRAPTHTSPPPPPPLPLSPTSGSAGASVASGFGPVAPGPGAWARLGAQAQAQVVGEGPAGPRASLTGMRNGRVLHMTRVSSGSQSNGSMRLGAPLGGPQADSDPEPAS